ncbi:uncharacterized protein TRUGW13939_10697 [Talaromyces rugulosus]|uniref:Uncharacterized protein n=1 Tax=Talaromyces rugulosus TaxID=121627 RepID=A0A7H8RB36_TALRU|nr:uncharacterized protein TRUGW13939_10697 [Talaromyces rugulosus]QKX63526.1 hypothetical protein TRUGW13939_10697 [Talaromyces rugulosus]
MSQNEIANNGWDLIAAASQKALNEQLAKIHPVTLKKQIEMELLGSKEKVDVDLVFNGPELRVRDGSGRQVDVLLPVQGTVKVDGILKANIVIPKGEKVTVTTELMQIENKLVPHPDEKQTNYDLMIDFKSEKAIVDMKLNIPTADLAFLIETMKVLVQKELHGGKEYKVASFALSNEKAKEYKSLIPHTADFSFVQDVKDPGRSNLLVLMQSVSEGKPDGGILFKKPLLASNQDFMVLASNKLFLEHFVLPPLIENLKKNAKDGDSLPKTMLIKKVGGSDSELYQLYNKSNINLSFDHDPWIDTMTAEIDTTEKALYFNLLVKVDATFIHIHGSAWDKSWQQFQVDQAKQTVTLKQIKEDKGKDTSMEWWKWLLACLDWIVLLVVGIIYAVVENKITDLGGTFVQTAPLVVQWPNQKYVSLKGMSTPSHVVLDLDVHFS